LNLNLESGSVLKHETESKPCFSFNGFWPTLAISIDRTTIGKTVSVGTRFFKYEFDIFDFPDMVIPPKMLGEMILPLEAIFAPILLTMRAWITLNIRSMIEIVPSHDIEATEGRITTILGAQKSAMPCTQCMPL